MVIVANKMNISLISVFNYQIIVLDLTFSLINVRNAILIIIYLKITVVYLECIIQYKKKNVHK